MRNICSRSNGRWLQGEARYAAMMLDQRDKIVNAEPIVSGKVKTEEQVYEAKDGGPGQDIYYKGAWMLHTLRNLIGDDDFHKVTQLEVYGRPDPKPGNFKPRFGSTDEYEKFVHQVTGKDYDWFFDVYLRQAKLPVLEQQRSGNTLTLTWKAPNDLPFPMPIEVQAGDKVTKLAMTGGTGSLTVPADAHVVVDPWDRVLKHSDAISTYQDWIKARIAERSDDAAVSDRGVPLMSRVVEMAAIFMVGDGLIGLLQPRRHVALWEAHALGAEKAVAPFVGRPGRRRLYAVVQIAAGLAIAHRQRP